MESDSLNTAVIAVGSNIEPYKNVRKAKKVIQESHDLIDSSKFILTEPIGFKEQPEFLNGSLLIKTVMNFEELRSWLSKVENSIGRVRTSNKFGPRTIDLDIVVWNNSIIDDDVYKRQFLLDSIKQILPDLEITG